MVTQPYCGVPHIDVQLGIPKSAAEMGVFVTDVHAHLRGWRAVSATEIFKNKW